MFLEKQSVCAPHSEDRVFEKSPCGRKPEADYQLGGKHGQFPQKIGNGAPAFAWRRAPVTAAWSNRPELQQIGNEDLVSRQTDVLQKLIKVPAGRSDERGPLVLFFSPGGFTDKDNGMIPQGARSGDKNPAHLLISIIRVPLNLLVKSCQAFRLLRFRHLELNSLLGLNPTIMIGVLDLTHFGHQIGQPDQLPGGISSGNNHVERLRSAL
jgi:hypothetical protein